MSKDGRTKLVTVTVLVAALGIGLARLKPLKPTPQRPDPQSAIYSMFDAARAGDVKTYLACYTGQMESSLRQAISESGEAGFSKYLRDSNAAVKGVAVSDPQKITEVDAKVRVEYVYQDRNEAQTLYLVKGPNGWRISGADGDERVKTLTPYGTPVR